MPTTSNTFLLGAVSLDIYQQSGTILPGGGCLNVAYHWQQLGLPFWFLTRIGQDQTAVFLDFFQRHAIAYLPETVIANGRSAAIDITLQPDGQPHMDNFVAGVWANFRLLPAEEALLTSATHLHTVLVEGMVRELMRLGQAGLLRQAQVAADFLDFRHYTVARLAETMAYVDIGFIGWPGAHDDALVAGMRQVAFNQHKLLIITLGARGVLVFNGRRLPPQHETIAHFIPVQPVPVQGTTVGCGDAFIAYFLANFWRSSDVVQAVEQGKIGGALATGWQRPLPDQAY